MSVPTPSKEKPIREETLEKTGQDICYFLSHEGICGMIRCLELKIRDRVIENVGFVFY